MCVLLLAWPTVAADWIHEARERGAVFEAQHEWDQAAAVYRSALARLNPSDPKQDRLWLLTSLVEVAFERQDYEEARRWLHEGLRETDASPADSPERIRLLTASGTLNLVEGNLTAAERDLSQAAATSERVATPSDLAAALHNLAAVEMQMRRLDEATVHETRALAIWRREFDDRHYYVMKAWISLSSLQGLQGDWQAAGSSLLNALAIAETPESLANYAVVLDHLKRGKEAREIRRHLRQPAAPSSPLVDVKAMAHEQEALGVRTR